MDPTRPGAARRLSRIHRRLAPLGNLFYPRRFADDTDYAYDGGGFETIPSIDREREIYDIRSYELAPGDVILKSLEKHNLIGLCFYDSGERSFYNTRQPIRTPEDMNGMKIRIQNSDLYVSMIRALGADATPMPLGEVYQSLVQGVIDGAENNWPSYESGRHFEAAPYYSLTRHVMAPEILVMSLSRWNKLSDEDRQTVVAAAKESVPVMRELWDQRVAGARERLLEAGIEVNEVDDLSAFQSLMEPVWDQFIVTPEQQKLVDDIQQIGARLETAS